MLFILTTDADCAATIIHSPTTCHHCKKGHGPDPGWNPICTMKRCFPPYTSLPPHFSLNMLRCSYRTHVWAPRPAQCSTSVCESQRHSAALSKLLISSTLSPLILTSYSKTNVSEVCTALFFILEKDFSSRQMRKRCTETLLTAVFMTRLMNSDLIDTAEATWHHDSASLVHRVHFTLCFSKMSNRHTHVQD